jgi:hypothetical protein
MFCPSTSNEELDIPAAAWSANEYDCRGWYPEM